MNTTNIQFSDLILDRIKLINTVFHRLSVKDFFRNTDILIAEDETSSRCITFSISQPNKICIPLVIILGENSIRVDIYDLVETFEWSKHHIETSSEEVMTFLEELFSSYILFESYGNPNKKSYMYLFDKNGVMIKEHPLRGLVHIFSHWNSSKSLFFPIYSRE